MASRTKYLILLVLTLCMGSCIRDNSGEGEGVLPTLSVTGQGEQEMATLNVDLGLPCVIEPDVKYNGVEGDLQYVWSVGTYNNNVKGKLEEVSRERVLRYTFPAGGTYYAHLIVNDGRQGAVVEYRVNVNRTFEEGYLLTSNDADGQGNLAFVKVMTAEEQQAGLPQVYVEHALERMNDMEPVGSLKNAVLGKISWPKSLTRVLVSLEDRCYFLDPNNFTIISQLDYKDVYPGFHADEFIMDGYYPFAFDRAMQKYVHLDMQYMFAFEYQYYLGHYFEDFFSCDYSFSGAVNNKLMFVNYTQPLVSEYNTYGAYLGDTNFPSTDELLAGRTILSVFLGANVNSQSFIVPEYVMALNGRRIELYSNTDNSYIGSKVFTLQTLVNRETLAVPRQGTRFVSSPRYNRHFYAIDNNVYVFLTGNTFSLPAKDNPSISFSETEEITFMRVNIPSEELYVATFDKQTQRGNFYIFDTADVRADNVVSPKPKAAHMQVAGRISNVIYKPSINN